MLFVLPFLLYYNRLLLETVILNYVRCGRNQHSSKASVTTGISTDDTLKNSLRAALEKSHHFYTARGQSKRVETS